MHDDEGLVLLGAYQFAGAGVDGGSKRVGPGIFEGALAGTALRGRLSGPHLLETILGPISRPSDSHY